jgi:hypothetical protein
MKEKLRYLISATKKDLLILEKAIKKEKWLSYK